MAHDWGMAIKEQRGKKNQWNSPVFAGDVAMHLDVLWPPGRHAMDFDNLIACFKRGCDQLEKQGILADDFQIKSVSWTQDKDPEKKGCVKVTLEGE
jgi:Holliday junction resolvase RusA-like endonuclease